MPSLPNARAPVQSKTAAPSQNAEDPGSGYPDFTHVTDPQLALPLAPRVEETAGAETTRVPFQWVQLAVGSESVNDSILISSAAPLKTLMAGYRHARLIALDALLQPNLHAYANPITVHMIWTTGDVKPASGDELRYYGGQVVTAGGPVSLNQESRIPANLTMMNPIIKSSLSYNDNPRLSFSTMKTASTSTVALGYVIIRGILELSGPQAQLMKI